MKKSLIAIAAIAFILSACGGNHNANVNNEPNTMTEFCYFSGEVSGNVEYTLLKKVKAAKGVYGSVTEVIPILEDRVIERGGNAVIKFRASQRFGWWPWSFVRPVATGRAIKITNANGLSCNEMGGRTHDEVMNGIK